MWSIIDSENISKKIVLDLFDGVETDLEEKVEITSKKDLLVYSYRVAGTVGLMMAKILKVSKKSSLKKPNKGSEAAKAVLSILKNAPKKI